MSDFSIPGVRLGIAQAGIKCEGRDDLTLIEIADGSSTAAVFTLNAFRAAPVVVAARNSINYNSINYLRRGLVRTGATVAFIREVCCERT